MFGPSLFKAASKVHSTRLSVGMKADEISALPQTLRPARAKPLRVSGSHGSKPLQVRLLTPQRWRALNRRRLALPSRLRPEGLRKQMLTRSSSSTN